MGQRPLFSERLDRQFVFYQVSFIDYASSTNSSSFNVSLPYITKVRSKTISANLLVASDHLRQVVFDHQCLHPIINSNKFDVFHRTRILSHSASKYQI